MRMISRRTFLKLAPGVAPLVFILPARSAQAQITAEPKPKPTRRPFGRAIVGGIRVRELPSVKAPVVRQLQRNEVIPVLGQVESEESPTNYNKIWYKTSDGWVHSAQVQPCENTLNTPITQIEKDALVWAELTVPLSRARVQPNPEARAPWTHYFGTIFQVLEVREGTDKKLWYRISDGILSTLWVTAEHLRILPPEEFAPISPNVPSEAKRLEVDLKAQRVYAYEGDRKVFEARCATGASFRQPDGTLRSFHTTRGNHHIYVKTPSQRMFDEPRTYDLPGIPWVAYFTSSGIAFHGTYWHNDYGKPRSHGCVNLLPEDAQWVYRWSLPVAPPDQRWTRLRDRKQGTLVRVF